MSRDRELELKLAVAPKDATRLESVRPLAVEPTFRQIQESIYFDTAQRDLGKAGLTLRVRQSGGSLTQTLKTRVNGVGLFDRQEWETPVRAMKPELEKAPSESLRHLLREAGETLRPVAKFRVKRTSWEINGHASTIEISLDRGVVSAGGSTRELNELELELKHGSQKALFDLCRTIAKRVPLRLEVLSKAELAEAMTEGRLEKPRKAPRVHLRPEMTVAEGFTQIVLSCLRHFRLNEDLLVTRRDPEALHQLHVALRRLHSAFLLFRPVVRGGRCRRHTRQMQRFGSMLGRARNLDTFIGLDEPHEAPRKVIRRRNAAYDKVIETLDSPRVPRLFLSILRWLFVGKWRLRSVADAPLEAFIAWRLEQSWTRLVHETPARHISTMGDRSRHRFRLRIKHFRYALDFSRGLQRGSKQSRKAFVRALEDLQEQLGLLNDRSIARRLAADTGHWPTCLRDSSIDSGILKAAERAFAELIEQGPYWREQTA